MSLSGNVTFVDQRPRGSELVGDHAASATTLTVANPTDFDDAGGLVRIDGVTYAFSGLTVAAGDEPTATITITPGLASLQVDGTPVSLWSGAQVIDDLILQVDTGGDSPALVSLRYDQRKDWPQRGPVDPPVPVTLDDDAQVLEDADGYSPPLDVAAGVNVPEPAAAAVTAPTTTPTLQVNGFPTAVQASVTNQPDAPAMVQFYVSPTNTAAMDSTTTFGAPTRQSIAQVGTLHDGTPLALDTPYFVAARFVNAAGSGPASAWVQGSLDKTAIATIAAQTAALGFVLSNRIQVGTAYIDANEGIVLLNPDGTKTVLPVNGTDPIQLAAYVVALALTVNNGMVVYGSSRFYGPAVLANGVSDPTVKAIGGRSWNSVQGTNDTDTFPQRRGLTQATNTTDWLTTSGGNFYALAKSNGNSVLILNGGSGTNGAGGVTRIGTNFYVLGQRGDGSWWVHIFDSSYNKTGEWQWNDSNGTQPAIGNDGTNVVIAQRRNAVVIDVYTYTVAGSPTTGLAGATKLVCGIGGIVVDSNLSSVAVGSFDLGATRVIITSRRGDVFVVDPTTGNRVSASEWLTAGSSQVLGMVWDGTAFHHVDSQGRIWDYNTRPADTVTDGAYSWLDNDTSSGSVTHETRAELTRASVTWKARTWLTITGAPAPEAQVTDPSRREKANLLRFYVATTGGGTLRAQSIGALNQVTSDGIASVNTGGATAKTTNEFAGVTGSNGSLTTSTGKNAINGDDTYALNGTPVEEAAASLSAAANTTVSYAVRNGFVYVTAASTATYATGNTTITASQIPAAYRPPANRHFGCSLAGVASILRVSSAGDLVILNNTGASRVGLQDIVVIYPRP